MKKIILSMMMIASCFSLYGMNISRSVVVKHLEVPTGLEDEDIEKIREIISFLSTFKDFGLDEQSKKKVLILKHKAIDRIIFFSSKDELAKLLKALKNEKEERIAFQITDSSYPFQKFFWSALCSIAGYFGCGVFTPVLFAKFSGLWLGVIGGVYFSDESQKKYHKERWERIKKSYEDLE